MFSMLQVVVSASADAEGFTFERFIDSLPTDPLSLFTIALLVIAGIAVVHFGRKSNPPRPRPPEGTP